MSVLGSDCRRLIHVTTGLYIMKVRQWFMLNLYIPIRMNGTIEGDITGVTGMDTEKVYMMVMTKDTMTAPANITDNFEK